MFMSLGKHIAMLISMNNMGQNFSADPLDISMSLVEYD